MSMQQGVVAASNFGSNDQASSSHIKLSPAFNGPQSDMRQGEVDPEVFECGDTDRDTDGDGILDSIDIDNDNDGIVDGNEGTSSGGDIESLFPNPDFEDFTSLPTSFTQMNRVVGWYQATGATSDYYHERGFMGPAGGLGQAPQTPDGEGFVGSIHVSSGYAEYVGNILTAPMIPGTEYSFDLLVGAIKDGSEPYAGAYSGDLVVYAKTGGVPSEFPLPISGYIGSTSGMEEVFRGSLSVPAGTWKEYNITFTPTKDYNMVIFGAENAVNAPGKRGAVLLFDALQLNIARTEDTDEDGIPDGCDLDSDNDGISDLVESGASASQINADSDRNGTVNLGESGVADADRDGLMDIFDNDIGNPDETASGGTDPVNSDGVDGQDFVDLDSDDDGIPDAVEAQLTDRYAIDFATDDNVTDDDADGDGVIGLYDNNGTFGGSFNDPVNTDTADEPDYIDTDSDNDGKSDTEEHGLTGESGGPANPTYPDPNGRINDPQTTLQNESGDNTEVAYRELWVPPTIDPDDKDGDGVPNATDIDDDNDGIVDREENINMDPDGGALVSGFGGSLSSRTNGNDSHAQLSTSATNNCPADQVAVGLYGGSVTNGMVGSNSVHSLNNGICVQVVPTADWGTMSVADFQTFDVLWIGNDDFTSIGGAGAFNVAVSSRPVWEPPLTLEM